MTCQVYAKVHAYTGQVTFYRVPEKTRLYLTCHPVRENKRDFKRGKRIIPRPHLGSDNIKIRFIKNKTGRARVQKRRNDLKIKRIEPFGYKKHS